MLLARISLTLCLSVCLSLSLSIRPDHPSLLACLPNSIPCLYGAVGQPTLAFSREGVQSAGDVEYTVCICGGRLDSFNECLGYDTKQTNGDAPVMLKLLGIWSAPSLLLLLCPLWPGVVAPDRVIDKWLNSCRKVGKISKQKERNAFLQDC